MSGSVCVIIAAKDSAATVVGAIRSALAEPEVARVVVVDDGSTDSTYLRVNAEQRRDSRVHAIQLDRNYGPSHARNVAIAASEEPFIAILDADDEFLPGRFARLFGQTDWDLVADNIAFVSRRGAAVSNESAGGSLSLTLASFVRGNISRGRVQRGEYGFLKPVIRRTFLEKTGFRYNDELRLGEDYDLYARLLASGAKFRVIRSCGYAALVRPNSLSGRHKTADLERLAAVDEALLRHSDLSHDARAMLLAHQRQTRERHMLRSFLDRRRDTGLRPAVVDLLKHRAAWIPVASGILRDKLGGLDSATSGEAGPDEVRYLLAPAPKNR